MTYIKIVVILSIFLLLGFLYSQETPVPPPFRQLHPGDWWLVKVEQMTIWKRSAQSAWNDAGDWKFMVKSKENQKLTVEVTNLNRPKDAQPWGLTLTYNENGEVIDAVYTVGDRTFTGETALQLIPLGKEGLSIGASLKKVKEAPITSMGVDILSQQEIQMARVDFDQVEAYQLWRPGEVWWRYFNKEKDLPVRAQLKQTSWWEEEKK